MKRGLAAAGLALAMAFGTGAASAQPSARAAAPPKLVVLIAVDQFSANLFAAWRQRFDGGLKRLSAEGIVYPSGYQSHAGTETCPGHSTLLTGKHPAKTGITANDWYDPATDKVVYCVADPRNTLAPPSAATPVGPANLKATTLGDWAKAASPANRVFAVSGKDRAAVTMAGHQADAVFFYVHGVGFSTYVRPGEDAAARSAPLAGYNSAFAQRLAAAPPLWTYTRDDCRALEATLTSPDIDAVGSGRQRTWRAALPPEGWTAQTPIARNAARYLASPYYDELVLDAAGALIDGQRLGRGPGTDILAVGLSATDAVGHRYGSAGPEMCEQMHRLDAALGAFLARLEALGAPVTVVLTADHGGLDMPERLRAQGYGDAGRLDGPALLRGLNAQLRARFRLAFDPLRAAGGDPAQLWLTGPPGRFAPGQAAKVLAAAKAALAAVPDVAAVHTRAELLAAPPPKAGTPPDELTLRERLQESAVPGLSGDLMVAFRPRLLPGGAITAGHGSPYDYDRRVPILFWSPGAPGVANSGAERPLPAETTDIAPTLANLIGVPAGPDLDGRCLDLTALGAPPCPPSPVP